MLERGHLTSQMDTAKSLPLTLPELQGGLTWVQGFRTSGDQFGGALSPRFPALIPYSPTVGEVRGGMLRVVRVRCPGYDGTHTWPALHAVGSPQIPPFQTAPEIATDPSVAQILCVESCCKEPGDLYVQEALVEARDRAREGGGTGTQMASVGPGSGGH